MRAELLENEQLDDLLLDGLKIIQKREGFRYGTDAVVLSGFARIGGNDRVLDIGTGGGILPVLLSRKGGREFAGIDVVPEMIEMAERSAALNGLSDRLKFECADVKEIGGLFPKRSFDVVVTNPPYKQSGSGIPSKNYNAFIARHEVLCNLEDVVRAASGLLKVGGRFYMVNRPDRLCDSLELMRKYGIEPKRLVFVHANALKSPVLFLVCGVPGAGRELIVGDPVILPENASACLITQDMDFECKI